MTTGNRYRNDPRRLQGKADIYEYIEGQERRIRSGETSYRAGHTAIEDGDFVVRNGDIIVSESDDTIVLRMFHGSAPAIAWYPLGEDGTHFVSSFGFDVGNPDLPETAFQLDITDSATFDTDGGFLLMWPGGMVIAHRPDVGTGGSDSQLWMNVLGDADLYYQGTFSNSFQISNEQGIYTGVTDIAAGFGSWTHTYFTPFASQVAPIIGLLNTAGAVSWNLSASSTSSFTVVWSGTLAKTMYHWVYRMP